MACRIENISMNTLVNRSIEMYVKQLRQDPDFKIRARELLEAEVANFKNIL